MECGDRLLDRAASVSHHEIVEAERVRYMERILSYYAPGLTFDIQSLRQAAEDLKSKRRESESDALSTKVDANELEDLAIDEEDFTIKALPNNTARKCPFYGYGLILTYPNGRIFWRIFISEFLYEDSEEDRRMDEDGGTRGELKITRS